MERKQFLLTAIGTRGDSQPLVVIAQRLQQDGHVVRVAVNPSHKESVVKQGVMYFPLEGFDPEALMSQQMGDRPGWDSYFRQRMYNEWFAHVCKSTWEAATAPLEDGTPFKPDVILSSHQQIAALPVAEKLRAQFVLFNTYPMSTTREFRHPFGLFLEGKDSRDTPLVNLFTYWAYDLGIHVGLCPSVRKLRKDLKLGSNGGWVVQVDGLLKQWKVPVFGIWSPNLLPRPADWHENLVVCGSVDRTGGLPELPADLVEYCRAGEPPIFFGFGPGSMSNIGAHPSQKSSPSL